LNQDLLANVIHRGRDHGLPSYTDVRVKCGFDDVKDFFDLNNTIDNYNINMLQQAYEVRIYANLHFVRTILCVTIQLFVAKPWKGLTEKQLFCLGKSQRNFGHNNNNSHALVLFSECRRHRPVCRRPGRAALVGRGGRAHLRLPTGPAVPAFEEGRSILVRKQHSTLGYDQRYTKSIT
jgi:hypothetical protein